MRFWNTAKVVVFKPRELITEASLADTQDIALAKFKLKHPLVDIKDIACILVDAKQAALATVYEYTISWWEGKGEQA